MYGLSQAGILTNQLLEKCLANKGYYQCQHTPGLWRHVWRDITFCLVVDDFGVKNTNMYDMDHLVDALKEHYTIAVDLTGSLFCGIQLTWITCKDTSIATCSATSTKPSQSTNTPNWSLPNMLPTRWKQSNMAQEFRGWRLTPHNHSPQNKLNVLKTLSVPSYTMCERLIQHFLLH
jgi:hypothetical protein